jgi:hypothetical protein
MNRFKKTSTRPWAVLAALALGAAAFLAIAGISAAKDRNHDRIPDRWELRHHLSLKVDQARRDQDRDHLRNRAEFVVGDNPRDRDSDDDGVMDGEENAGTIASFDAASGRLVIDLFGKDTIAGTVTSQTRIKCEDHHNGVHDEPGDDHGGRDEAEPGDDHGDGDNSGPGSSHSDRRGRDGDDDANCTVADLKVGAVVEEAELEIEHGQATFEEVELVR